MDNVSGLRNQFESVNSKKTDFEFRRLVSRFFCKCFIIFSGSAQA